MICGWFRYICIFSSLMNCSVISSSFKSCFGITFNAHMNPDDFYYTKYTFPYFPCPSYFIFLKSATLSFLFSGLSGKSGSNMAFYRLAQLRFIFNVSVCLLKNVGTSLLMLLSIGDFCLCMNALFLPDSPNPKPLTYVFTDPYDLFPSPPR